MALSLSIPKLRRLQAPCYSGDDLRFCGFPGLRYCAGVCSSRTTAGLCPATFICGAHGVPGTGDGTPRVFSIPIAGFSLPGGSCGSGAGASNAVVSAATFAVPLLLAGVTWVVRSRELTSRQKWVGSILLLAVLVGCEGPGVYYVPLSLQSNTWSPIPDRGVRPSISSSSWAWRTPTSWVISLIPPYLAGFLVLWVWGYLLYKRRNLWLIASWVLIGYLWIVSASVPRGEFRLLMVCSLVHGSFPSGGSGGIPLGDSSGYWPGWLRRRSAYLGCARAPRPARLKVATIGMGVAMILVLVVAGLSSRVPSGAGDDPGGLS